MVLPFLWMILEKAESNLMYIVEMPVSIVKLDYDMLKAFFRSPKAKTVVQAVVNMAHNMNLKMVAEGIETEEEIQGMSKENIDYIQGYYYSCPVPQRFFGIFKEQSTRSLFFGRIITPIVFAGVSHPPRSTHRVSAAYNPRTYRNN